jgi:hypothetical protein
MATKLEDKIDPAALYDADFYAWATQQAATLRQLQASQSSLPLDFENLIEEIDGLAKRQLSAVRSQLKRVIVHYLKLEHSPSVEPRKKWRLSIIDAQDTIDEDWTPAISRACAPALPQIYRKARRVAAAELDINDEPEAAASLPETCPYTLDQLLDETWRPTNRHGLVDEPL